MEGAPQQDNWREKMELVIEKERADLRALSELLDLPIIREEKFNGVWSIVVDNGEGQEVHIGFPGGTHTTQGKAREPAVTGTIYKPNVKMGMYGHGPWKRSILI